MIAGESDNLGSFVRKNLNAPTGPIVHRCGQKRTFRREPLTRNPGGIPVSSPCRAQARHEARPPITRAAGMDESHARCPESDPGRCLKAEAKPSAFRARLVRTGATRPVRCR
jgi:hypothetical protein